MSARAPALDAATLSALVPMCEQAAGRWPTEFPEQSKEFAELGRELAIALHERAHAATPSEPPEVVGEWRAVAIEVCKKAALADPDWFCHYWRGVVRQGVRPPIEITRLLVALDVLRPITERLRMPVAE